MARKCKGLKANGRLRKGYKWPGGGRCPVKVSSTKTKRRGRRRKSSGLSGVGRVCSGLGKSGRKKGKLLKGYTWKGARGGCPRKVA